MKHITHYLFHLSKQQNLPWQNVWEERVYIYGLFQICIWRFLSLRCPCWCQSEVIQLISKVWCNTHRFYYLLGSFNKRITKFLVKCISYQHQWRKLNIIWIGYHSALRSNYKSILIFNNKKYSRIIMESQLSLKSLYGIIMENLKTIKFLLYKSHC